MTAPKAGRPRDPATDAAIMRAALELFIERGVDGTSIEQIAKNAGVARLTVYRRWSSKEELLAHAIDFARNAPALTDEDYDTLPWPVLFGQLADTLADSAATRQLGRLLSQLIGSAYTHPSLLAAFWVSSGEPRRLGGIRMIERAKREGLMPEYTDPEVVLNMLVGAVIFKLVVLSDTVDPDDLRQYVFTVLRQAGFTFPPNLPPL